MNQIRTRGSEVDFQDSTHAKNAYHIGEDLQGDTLKAKYNWLDQSLDRTNAMWDDVLVDDPIVSRGHWTVVNNTAPALGPWFCSAFLATSQIYDCKNAPVELDGLDEISKP